MRARHSVLVAVALLAGSAGSAQASSILADASGSVWGTGASERNSGSGSSPVTATASYVRPPGDGQFSAFAVASVGRLAATAGLSVSNQPLSLFGDPIANAQASFQDVWTFGGQPLDTPGRLRITLSFSGVGSGSATGAVVDVFGIFNLSLNSMTALSNVHDSDSYISGQQQAVSDLVVIDLDFLYGRPVLITGTLAAHFQLRPTVVSGGYSGSGQAQFGNTAELIALEVQDAQGQWTTSYVLGTESGGLYPFQVVPEPALSLLVAFGVFVLVIGERRRFLATETVSAAPPRA
jgi:hypothetical protein